MRAEWIAVYVETPAQRPQPRRPSDRVVQHLRLAEQLGAETITLSGRNLAEEIVDLRPRPQRDQDRHRQAGPAPVEGLASGQPGR